MVCIGLVLSEEKIFEKVYDVRRTNDDDGRQVMAIPHITLWGRRAKKGALDSQPQVIKFTSCLPRVGDSPAFSTTKTGPLAYMI
jgi:hypothetical protein